jgi:hypothetical protein
MRFATGALVRPAKPVSVFPRFVIYNIPKEILEVLVP